MDLSDRPSDVIVGIGGKYGITVEKFVHAVMSHFRFHPSKETLRCYAHVGAHNTRASDAYFTDPTHVLWAGSIVYLKRMPLSAMTHGCSNVRIVELSPPLLSPVSTDSLSSQTSLPSTSHPPMDHKEIKPPVIRIQPSIPFSEVISASSDKCVSCSQLYDSSDESRLPYQLHCCGAQLCRECVLQTMAVHGACTLCHEPIDASKDIHVLRMPVLSLSCRRLPDNPSLDHVTSLLSSCYNYPKKPVLSSTGSFQPSSGPKPHSTPPERSVTVAASSSKPDPLRIVIQKRKRKSPSPPSAAIDTVSLSPSPNPLLTKRTCTDKHVKSSAHEKIEQ